MCKVEVTDLRRSFADRDVLRGVSFSVESGQSALLTGKNGVGKSTLLRIVGGVLSADSGSVRLAGRPPREAIKSRKPRVAFHLQESLLYGDLTVGENLRLTQSHLGFGGATLKAIVGELEIERFLETALRDTSQGVAQKTSLARCFLSDPQLLLLDEPFSHLDAASRIAVGRLLGKLVHNGATVICVTHDENVSFTPTRRLALSAEGMSEEC